MHIVGILNITPDSCSDGGLYFELPAALKQARKMMQDGALMIDIGGESVRPGALATVSAEEEQQRILPVLKALIAEGITQISVDTRNANTAKACLKLGVSWLNDVSALTHDAGMVEVAQ